jgi:CHRD domain
MHLRMLGIGAATAAVFAAGLWSGIGSAGWLSADADPVGLTATLSAAKEVPKPTGVRGGAGGSFTAGLTRKGTGGTLSWRLTFHGLTGSASAAHVHLAKPGVAGPVAVPLCGPCRSGARGTAKVKARTVTALLGGGAYVNVHTAKNPAGEIRGQIRKGGKALPLPTTPTTTTTTTTTTTYPGDPYP